MKLPSRIVGAKTPAIAQTLDARWVMAYSAGIGETDARCYDTAGELPVHPVFPVCYEWEPLQPVRNLPELREVYSRLVHAEHHIVLHRPLRAGETARTAARIVAVLARSPGAFVVFRCDTTDAKEQPVVTSHYGYLYRGVALEGRDAQAADLPQQAQAAAGNLSSLGEIAIAATAAHVYTECARIFNPIHTDIAYARAAGLPGIILHGTATLALSVSRALRSHDIEWRRVRALSCRFSGMVLMPSTLTVLAARKGGEIGFEAANDRGDKVISRGRLLLE